MAEENPVDEEIDLARLSDEDLTAQMHDDLYDGLADEIVEGILSNRVQDPDANGLTPQKHETWLMTALVVDIEKMKMLKTFRNHRKGS